MIDFPPDLLLPDFPGLRLDKLQMKANLITIELNSTNPLAYCPLCNEATRQVHSRYVRQIQDLP
jgi:transposase